MPQQQNTHSTVNNVARVCVRYLNKNCQSDQCAYKHPKPQHQQQQTRPWTAICFAHNTPDGCQRPNCKFHHKRQSSEVCRFYLDSECRMGEFCPKKHTRSNPSIIKPAGIQYPAQPQATDYFIVPNQMGRDDRISGPIYNNRARNQLQPEDRFDLQQAFIGMNNKLRSLEYNVNNTSQLAANNKRGDQIMEKLEQLVTAQPRTSNLTPSYYPPTTYAEVVQSPVVQYPQAQVQSGQAYHNSQQLLYQPNPPNPLYSTQPISPMTHHLSYEPAQSNTQQ